MLGKLMKHEFRATARIMLPVMGAMVALALLANLSIRGLAGNLSDIPMLRILFVLIIIFFSVAVVATIVMSLVIMVSRFYRNLLKDEGYLMFTLPVSVHELIWSKLIVRNGAAHFPRDVADGPESLAYQSRNDSRTAAQLV